ncbi:MAG: hypothetical protein R8N50_03500 [Alphaproteobacteria bacterium]|nr:hypothetical protein [Alphaproteobacteria bacterium]
MASANILPLDDALRATYTACVGIDDELADLKTMAGINTAITSVGTAAGVGATVTGFVKQSKDNQAEELEKLIKELEELEKNAIYPTDAEQQAFLAEFEQSYDIAIKDIDDAQAELDKLTKQSKKLGNWRTGLMAGATATNVAGAIIAGTNKVDGDLQTQIDNCVSNVKNLQNSIMQALINGEDVSEAQSIASACGEYEYVDVSKINNRGRGAMISSTVGAATGLAGTITSASANSKDVRNSDDKQREKNLNTASNVLAIGTTAASATATVFNATQISAIKKVAAVAEKCTGVLK